MARASSVVATDAGESVPESAPEQLGRKFDNSKVPVSKGVNQYFPRALLAVGAISLFGSIKYEWFNWQFLDDAQQRYEDAGARHLLYQYIDGPYDSDSDMLHQAHKVWCELAKLELMLRDGTSLERKE